MYLMQPEGALPGVADRILCTKCGFANRADVENCGCCSHHLHVFCHCGARNPRSRDHCHTCGERLRRRKVDVSELVLINGSNRVFGHRDVPPPGDQLCFGYVVVMLVLILFLLVCFG